MLGYHTPQEAHEAAGQKQQLWAELVQDPTHRPFLDFFGRYWQNYFRPRLLE